MFGVEKGMEEGAGSYGARAFWLAVRVEYCVVSYFLWHAQYWSRVRGDIDALVRYPLYYHRLCKGLTSSCMALGSVSSLGNLCRGTELFILDGELGVGV